MRLRTSLLLAVSLSSGLSFAAAAQTGRIAHFSHSGSRSALTNESDNFGLYMRSYWKADTLVYLNDSTVLHKGMHSRSYYGPPQNEAGWRRRVEEVGNFSYYYQKQSLVERLENLRKEYPKATYIGFDKLRQAVPKKPAGRVPSFQKRPFQYSYWRGLATVAALGAVGWLLGRKPTTV